MENSHKLLTDLREAFCSERKHMITGRNAFARDLFEFLFIRSSLQCPFMILCTKKGQIIYFFCSNTKHDFSGYTISDEILASIQTNLTSESMADYYVLFSQATEDSISLINQLKFDFQTFLHKFDISTGRMQYLLNCLDSMENPLCICDNKPSLLYANQSYCKTMNIADRDSIIGMEVNEIFEQSGVSLHATKNISNKLKMYDVIKNGEKVLGWEMIIESQTASAKAPVVSNNLYPIKDKNGKVEGVIEIIHYNQLNLNKVNRVISSEAEYTFDSIIGSSAIISERIQQAKDYANSKHTVLIVGESGVGKELFAQAIHNYSDRIQSAFVAINCANFPENLIESELFGYVGGAFTGSSKNGQIGKFELADGGTLFLDEVGELPYHFQSKLLRVLETSKITRIGGTKEINVDVRIVAATNRDLESMVDEGLFRKDLYYRLQVLNIEIPPLRERREDVVLLAEDFLRQNVNASDCKPKKLDASAKKSLMEYDWPGNVRELRNVIHRIALLSKNETITRYDLEASIYSKGHSFKSNVHETPESRLNKCMVEVNNSYKNLINEALDIAGGNKRHAADILGVSRATFYRMIEKYCP